MTEDQTTETPAAKSRTGLYLLLGAVGLLLIPVVIGFTLANTGGTDESGMGDSAMGGDSPTPAGFPVRDIDEILDGDIAVEVDATGTSAVLRLGTTIDVACSVVFGPTTAFGGIATDTDMAGGAHSIHQPLMTGLEPGTTVLYRVQGTAADGTIYVSDVERFTTPAADGTALPKNLTVTATVTDVSSEFSASFAGANAIDGSLASEWSSRGDGNDAYIVVDLGTTRDVTGFGFRTREMSDGTSITNAYTVTVDGGEALGPFPAGIGLTVSNIAVTGQLFRFDLVDTTGGNTGAVEIEIYGE